jgi:hypothetical protein
MEGLVAFQIILFSILTLISGYILMRRLLFKEGQMYIEWQFPMLLALLIDLILRN